jgi:hypothetical protein
VDTGLRSTGSYSFTGTRKVEAIAVISVKMKVISLAGTPFEIKAEEILGSTSSLPLISRFSFTDWLINKCQSGVTR